jgi:hypothetical protein
MMKARWPFIALSVVLAAVSIPAATPLVNATTSNNFAAHAVSANATGARSLKPTHKNKI